MSTPDYRDLEVDLYNDYPGLSSDKPMILTSEQIKKVERIAAGASNEVEEAAVHIGIIADLMRYTADSTELGDAASIMKEASFVITKLADQVQHYYVAEANCRSILRREKEAR
ncbi:MAG: hypothetical protein HON68_02700 [Gammaproteobacteria bacterium]|jgi:hypothetical protein|nr:hypothetical protein [Gammaproteobacteria bacterium]MBT5235834.1 hypothetical protein [Candidatus Neomarinimicrobiota bacterium]MBT3490394.1 hypothetical protein [Gammaproteobacteria bacterium]MBT3718140.1 hypothetical protein [Gammaproteobacteria bacterium]MBT3845546.1 hypothetical protein [Gammaproteobacteria bacterium]